MPRLVIATIATSAPMGQQVYEESICARAADALDLGWQVKRSIVRSLRAPLEGNVRLPARVMVEGHAGQRAAIGRVIYGRGLVHRMDLRLPPAPAPEILTIHDAVSWRFPDEAWPPACAPDEARKAVRVICPSQFSADELSRFFGIGHITVIPNGVDEAYFSASPLTEAEREELGLTEPYVLHAGGGGLRKNLEGLAAAWPMVRRARPNTTLALIGSSDDRKKRLFAGQAGARLLGRLDSAMVRSVMASAAAVVVPSVYEGFGLPALEGMAVQTPVVAANRSSLPEVCADAAILVEPTGKGLAEGLLEALEGGPSITAMVERGRDHAAQYTWERSAAQHAEVWTSV